MNKKKILLTVLIVLLLITLLYTGLGRYRRGGKTAVSVKIDDGLFPTQTLGPKVPPDQPEEVPGKSAQGILSRRSPKEVAESPPTEPKKAYPPISLESLAAEPVRKESALTPSSVSLEALPTEPAQVESAMKRSVPKSVILRAEEMPMLKLCKGEPISECLDCGLTHCDFALLVLDILALGKTENCGEAFEILESGHIGPVDGWNKASPFERMKPIEIEEVRCSLSLAFEDGFIPVEASLVTVALNRFCEELKVSLKAMEDSGAVRGGARVSAETGYQGGAVDQGGGGGVSSPPF